MAGSVNKVILVGRLGKDPETRNFANGGKIVTFSLATSETWRDKQSGDRKERTEWHTVAITNEGLAKIAEQYLRKGSNVYIEGQLSTRKWQDQSGADRYSTEVVLRPFHGELTLLDSKGDGGRDDDHRRDNPPAQGGQSGGYGGGNSDLDDEIPF